MAYDDERWKYYFKHELNPETDRKAASIALRIFNEFKVGQIIVIRDYGLAKATAIYLWRYDVELHTRIFMGRKTVEAEEIMGEGELIGETTVRRKTFRWVVSDDGISHIYRLQ